MQYNPALDGIRALAVLAVIAFHAAYPVVRGGMIGVDVFFVLSGYLITTILRGELKASGGIDLKQFYVRRFVRLMPPLVLCMVCALPIYAVIAPDLDLTADVVLSLLYVSDYSLAFWGTPEHLRHTWSLAVEEHFYLVWPLFLIATRNLTDRGLLRLLLLLFAAATAWKFFDGLFWDNFARTYYRFDTRVGGMILGSCLAAAQFRPRNGVAWTLGTLALATLVLLALNLHWKTMNSLLFGGFAAELAAAALIVAVTSGHRNRFWKLLSHPWLAQIGMLSYSIYLWHHVFAYVARNHVGPLQSFSFSFSASFIIAALSHRYIEAPLRQWARHRTGKTAQDGQPIYAG
jgi:peptidoglycan/LPS O-acetylase OafA/YrhL